jgi:hypothetical protein
VGNVLHIAAGDNVVVALRAIAGGTVVDGVTVAADIQAGHKIAIQTQTSLEHELAHAHGHGLAHAHLPIYEIRQ